MSVSGLKIWRDRFLWVGGRGGRGSEVDALVVVGGRIARVGWDSSGVGGGGNGRGESTRGRDAWHG